MLKLTSSRTMNATAVVGGIVRQAYTEQPPAGPRTAASRGAGWMAVHHCPPQCEVDHVKHPEEQGSHRWAERQLTSRHIDLPDFHVRAGEFLTAALAQSRGSREFGDNQVDIDLLAAGEGSYLTANQARELADDIQAFVFGLRALADQADHLNGGAR